MAEVVDRIGTSRQAARLNRRDRAERLLAWADYLPERDRLLLEAVYRDGRLLREIAGLTDRSPKAIGRRVRQLVRRTRHPVFRLVATREALLPQEVQATARRRYLEGRSLRDTARLTGTSLHRVRQHVLTIESIARVV